MMAVPNSGWIHTCPVGDYLASIACICKQLDEVPRPPYFRTISPTRSGVRLGTGLRFYTDHCTNPY